MRTKSVLVIVSIVVALSILLLAIPNERTQAPTMASSSSNAADIRGAFTCETWKHLAYFDMQKYQQCLKWKPDQRFWSVQLTRHVAHHGLLNSSSLVIDVGGNVGLDIAQFVEFYNPTIIGFEPLVSMAEKLMEKFKSNPKIEIRPYGLANRARNVSVEPFDDDSAGTSVFRELSTKNSTSVRIQLLDVIDVMQSIRRTRTHDGMIDMLSMNCEGCEFEVLPALILNNMTQYFRIIQFGTHTTLLSQSTCIYCQIEQALERTHQIKYHYAMLWEGWLLKNNTNH